MILYIVRKLITLALQRTYDQFKGLGLSKVITKKVKTLQIFLQFFEIVILKKNLGLGMKPKPKFFWVIKIEQKVKNLMIDFQNDFF